MEAEPGGYHNGNVNNWQFDTTTLFGPRLSWGRSKRIDPCFHILWGGQYATTSIAASLVVVVNPHTTTKLQGSRYTASTNAFAMAVGGGLDIKLNRPVVFRPIQLDYLLTRFEVINVTVPPGQGVPSARNQNNLRYAAGVAFLFGGEKPGPATKPCPDGSTVPIDHPCPKLNTNLGLSCERKRSMPGSCCPGQADDDSAGRRCYGVERERCKRSWNETDRRLPALLLWGLDRRQRTPRPDNEPER